MNYSNTYIFPIVPPRTANNISIEQFTPYDVNLLQLISVCYKIGGIIGKEISLVGYYFFCKYNDCGVILNLQKREL